MKMRYYSCNIILAVTLIMLSGCATDDKKQVETPPIEKTADTIGLETNNNIYTSWEEFYKKEDISFALDSFFKNDTIIGELHITSYKPNDSFYTNFGNLLVYNSDSTMFIDAFSTNWIIERDRNGKLTAREGEIDQEVTVVDKKAQTRNRLFYCGPGCQVQKVFWYNDDIVGIMGLMTEYSDEYYTPTIWFVNIHNGITIPYEYNSSVSIIQANDFMKNHLESRGVNVDY